MARQASGSAWLDGHRIAASENVLYVEGTPYFPIEDVDDDALTPVRFKSLCYWKGFASYYDVTAGETVAKRSAWTYRHPTPLARRVKDRIAFWYDIEVRIGE